MLFLLFSPHLDCDGPEIISWLFSFVFLQGRILITTLRAYLLCTRLAWGDTPYDSASPTANSLGFALPKVVWNATCLTLMLHQGIIRGLYIALSYSYTMFLRS